MGRHRENFVVELLENWTITASNGYTYKDSPYYTKKRLPKSIRQSFFVVLVPLKVRRG